MSSSARPECLIVGAGVIGLSIAEALARSGAQVSVLERSASCGQGASGAAAGMLAGGAEATAADPFQQLCQASRQLWPEWAADLEQTSGVDCELELSGLLRVTGSEQGARELERISAWQCEHGVDVSGLLDRAQLAQLVPGLGSLVLAGVHYRQDGHVHTHRLTEALVSACLRRGVIIETETEVTELEIQADRPRLTVSGGRQIEADYLVVCAGSWSGEILPAAAAGALLEPIRGQMVAFDPGRPLIPMIVFGDHGYLLQKRSGLILAGATEERVGYQPWPTLEGVSQLTTAAADLVPQLRQARFASAWAGLRPHARDGWPLLGRTEMGGSLLLATGHYRNGILLAPVTAALVARAVLEGVDPPELAPFSPGRLA
ncbi:MAG: glycine oxidase ThiO [Candidatus Dormiibacterota bacterium]